MQNFAARFPCKSCSVILQWLMPMYGSVHIASYTLRLFAKVFKNVLLKKIKKKGENT